MTDQATQLAPVVFERIIDATPDEAFALFTEPERLRRWKAVSAAVDLRVGGDYRLTVTPGHIASGTFTEIEPGRRVVYTWGWVGSDDLPPGSVDRGGRHRTGGRQDARAGHPSRPVARSGRQPRRGLDALPGAPR